MDEKAQLPVGDLAARAEPRAGEGGVGEDAFRGALRLFASGVTIVSTVDTAGVVHGLTATAFSSLSLRPPLIMVAVALSSRSHRLIAACERFGVSILRADQADLSRHFGRQRALAEPPRFESFAGVEVVPGAIVSLACSLETRWAGGDHSIFVGRVTAARTGRGDPLVHYDSRYRALSR